MYKLLQGDCLELMNKIPDKSIDAVICDLHTELLNVLGILSFHLINYGNNTICKTCGKVMDEPASFWMPCSSGHVPLIHQTEFLCKECHNGGSNNGKTR